MIGYIWTIRVECTRCQFTLDVTDADLPRSRWRAAAVALRFLESKGWQLDGRTDLCAACIFVLTELADLPDTGDNHATGR